MFRHLRSARQWLARAEESISQDRDIRAELDIILAQAELQHVREARRSRHWRYRYPLLWRGAVIALTMLITVGAGGTYWWLQSRHQAVPIPLLPADNVVSTSSPQTLVVAPQPPVQTPQPAITTTPVTTATTTGTQQPVPEAKTKTLPSATTTRAVSSSQPTIEAKTELISREEMEQIIRAAGKSLRGQ